MSFKLLMAAVVISAGIGAAAILDTPRIWRRNVSEMKIEEVTAQSQQLTKDWHPTGVAMKGFRKVAICKP